MRTIPLALLVLVLAGCGDGAGAPPDRARRPVPSSPAVTAEVPDEGAVTIGRASDPRLEIELALRPGEATLSFFNPSPEPVRIYLPRAEAFRGGMSTLYFHRGERPPTSFPSSRGHGIVIEEEDFPLIAPGETLRVTQTLPAQFEPGGRVGWTYRNEITRWEGGRQTLDGPTRELFDGEDIPHIWTGQLQVDGVWAR